MIPPKLGILDFIVYIVCVLSFWFGVCPLQVFQVLKSKPVQDLMNKIATETVIMKVKAMTLYLISLSLLALFTSLTNHEICDNQYFRYPTITSVSMIDALPLTFPPKKLPSNYGILRQLQWLFGMFSSTTQITVGFIITQRLRRPFVDI